MPLNDPAQQFVFGERGGSVDTVIVDGKVVVEKGRALTIDEKAVLNAAKSILPSVRSRNAGVRAIAELSPRWNRFLSRAASAERMSR